MPSHPRVMERSNWADSPFTHQASAVKQPQVSRASESIPTSTPAVAQAPASRPTGSAAAVEAPTQAPKSRREMRAGQRAMKRGWTDQIRVITAPIPSTPVQPQSQAQMRHPIASAGRPGAQHRPARPPAAPQVRHLPADIIGATPQHRVTTAPKPHRPGVSAGQLSVASVLGLVTIASPLSSGSAQAFSAGTDTAQEVQLRYATSATFSAAPLGPGADGVSALQVLTPAGNLTSETTTEVAAQAPKTLLVDKPSRSNERAVLPGCDGDVDVQKMNSYSNGRIPKSSLCDLWMGGHQLRPDAAVALAKLNYAYKQRFGHDMKVTDSYRSYDAQVELKKRKPYLAARPGTSNHGLGKAVDLGDGIQNFNSTTYRWMRDNAPAFGWQNPDWARPGGSKPEPWHWEYQG